MDNEALEAEEADPPSTRPLLARIPCNVSMGRRVAS